ncbi:hypothetical protein M569_00962, partial [Genlisea aurea]
RTSYKNATILLCFINLIAALSLIRAVLHSTPRAALARNMKESEDARRSMIPWDLITRVREIREEVSVDEVESVLHQQKEAKQNNAGNLMISRLNNFHSYSDSANVRALEEWRKRKIERARQRSLTRNGT